MSGRFRASFCWNDGKKRGNVQSTAVVDVSAVPDFLSLAQLCSQKLRPLISKAAFATTRVYVKECPSRALPVGFEFTSSNVPHSLLSIPSDGLILAVSPQGLPFSGKQLPSASTTTAAAADVFVFIVLSF
ncbi:MAG: hypothetical protein Q8P67_22555 [archaeon]|nr:hypothetical protein [archaeon]